MSADGKAELVLIGKITKAHSIRGEVKIYPYSGAPENFLAYDRILLQRAKDAAPIAYAIKRARAQKNAVLLQLEHCATRNDAEQLVRAEVYIHQDDLPEPDQDEFYLRDLEGREMKMEEGEVIGRITGLLQVSGQDLAQVKNQGQEYLIPLIPEFLVAIEADEVRVSLPPGLLDINT